jgi:hypothetical protein
MRRHRPNKARRHKVGPISKALPGAPANTQTEKTAIIPIKIALPATPNEVQYSVVVFAGYQVFHA